MKCNSEVHLQNKDKVFFFFFFFNLAILEQYIGSTLSTNFSPKDIEFVRPTAYFLNSGMHQPCIIFHSWHLKNTCVY